MISSAHIEQRTYYETGNGARKELRGDLGSVKRRAHNCYRWLSSVLFSNEDVFIFGAGTGGLVARYLQGIIHSIGIANTDPDKVLDAYEAGRKSDVTTAPKKIRFLGLFDATLLKTWDTLVLARFKLTSSVKELAHALALSEYREVLEAAELMVERNTREEQVWFMGMQGDVTGGEGLGIRGASHITLAWMVDKAVSAGLKLKQGSDRLLEIADTDVVEDIADERGLHHTDSLSSTLLIRNPFRCRKETGRENIPVHFHKSVQKRMALIREWVPLPYCCTNFSSEMTMFPLTYTSNRWYEKMTRTLLSRGDPPPNQWLLVKLGTLEKATVSKFYSPKYYVKIQSWSSMMPLEDGKRTAPGCCVVQHVDPVGNVTLFEGMGEVNFNKEVLVPYEPAIADLIIVDVFSANMLFSEFMGRVKLSYTDQDSLQMKARTLKGLNTVSSIEVQLEYLPSDKAALSHISGNTPQSLGDGATQCAWLSTQSGQKLDDLCTIKDLRNQFQKYVLRRPELTKCDAFVNFTGGFATYDGQNIDDSDIGDDDTPERAGMVDQGYRGIHRRRRKSDAVALGTSCVWCLMVVYITSHAL